MEYKFKKFLEKKDIDPFDEEDWDEIDSNIFIFKVRITLRLKEISIVFFPAYIQKVKDKIIILDDRRRKIYMDSEDKFNTKVINGIESNNLFIVNGEFVNKDMIENFIEKYIGYKKLLTEKNIREYNRVLDGDYDEDDDEYDIDEIERNLIKEKLLLYNLKNFNIKENVNLILKEFNRY